MKTEYDFFKEEIKNGYGVQISVLVAESNYRAYLAEKSALFNEKMEVSVQEILDFDKKWGTDIFNTGQ